MGVSMEKKSCMHAGTKYLDGQKRCYDKYCFFCKDGQWLQVPLSR